MGASRGGFPLGFTLWIKNSAGLLDCGKNKHYIVSGQQKYKNNKRRLNTTTKQQKNEHKNIKIGDIMKEVFVSGVQGREGYGSLEV